MHYDNNMRERRKAANLSINKAAVRADISLGYWNMLERGTRPIDALSMGVARRICEALRARPEEVFPLVDD